jgi:hypothetical protein
VSSAAAAVALMSPLYYSTTPISGPSHGLPITVSNKAAQKLLSNMAVSSDSIQSISCSSRAVSPATVSHLHRPHHLHSSSGQMLAGSASLDSYHRMKQQQDSTGSHLGVGNSSRGRIGETSSGSTSRWRMSDI